MAGKVLEVEFPKNRAEVVELVRSIELTVGEKVAVLDISVVNDDMGVHGEDFMKLKVLTNGVPLFLSLFHLFTNSDLQVFNAYSDSDRDFGKIFC